MRVTLLASGSRGDVQPFVALGRGLAEAGYQVTIAAPRNFSGLIRAQGLTCRPFSVDVDELVRSDLGRSWLGHSSHSPMTELRLLTALVEEWAAPMAEELLALKGTADLFISGIMTVGAAEALVAHDRARHVCALLAPFHPTAEGRSGLHAPLPGRLSPLNRAAGEALVWGVARGFGSSGAALRRLQGVPARYRGDYRRALLSTPTLIGASPLVVPQPADWPNWVGVTGYWVLPGLPEAAPADGVDSDLSAFVAAGPAPVYVGFGSMSTHDPEGTWRELRQGLAGRRAIVHSGGADLRAAARRAPEPSIRIVDDVSHEWLFPRLHGVVHHGGAGTTAAGLRAGVPSAAVPHIGDQPYWGRRIHQLGVGPAPVARHRLRADRLEAMVAAFDDLGLRDRAQRLGRALRAEDGVAQAVRLRADFGLAPR